MPGVFVYAETSDGTPSPVALELLTKARSLGPPTAIALGPGATKAADALARHGAKKVYVHEDAAFREILASPVVDLLAKQIGKDQPDLVLFGMTYDGRDVAARLSARLGTALIANATDIARRNGGWAVTTPMFGGSLLVTTVPKAKAPTLVLLRPKAVAAQPEQDASAAQVETLSDPIDSSKPVARVLRREKEKASGPKLEEAAVIVSGGRGLGAPDKFKMLDELVGEFGAAGGALPARVHAGRQP